jgi:hypothetical protein
MTAGLPAVELDPSVGATRAPLTEADRAATVAGAPLPRAALPCLELEDDDRSGFMSIWDGLWSEDARSWNWVLGQEVFGAEVLG